MHFTSVKSENKETKEGPGFVSEAFRSRCALLQTWMTKHAGEQPIRGGSRTNEKILSKWVNHVRQAWKANCLNRTQLELLQSISGLSVTVTDRVWESTCAKLRCWLEKHCSKNSKGEEQWSYPRRKSEDEEEKHLAKWLDNNQRWQEEAQSSKTHFERSMCKSLHDSLEQRLVASFCTFVHPNDVSIILAITNSGYRNI